MDSPIIPTLLDTDLYKYTMQQSMVHRYPDAWARMEFHCRSDQPLALSKKQLKRQCEFLGELRLGSEELEWLSTLPFIADDFIEYLEGFRLDPHAVAIEQTSGQLSLVIEGLWSEITHFEIFLLAIVSELHGHSFYGQGAQDDVITQGQRRLDEKLSQLPGDSGITLVDFGTRRRFSRDWHYHVVESLKHRLPDNFVGTSNLNLARTLGLKPVGTMAHEWLQSHQVLGQSLRTSQKDALRVWLDEYQGQLGIALTDTINMAAFLKDFDVELARAYQGMRHDSGDPFVWGELALDHYRRLGIDPRSKSLVFSDKLNFDKALAIYQWFAGKINVSFGIGTYLTNDMGFNAPNIVLKLTELNGAPVAKLSDSPGKTLCRDKDYIERLKKTFGYQSGYGYS
ncbi:nicotinate phosphoribosyltransferase [Thalassotalea sp. G20_0]|uniref:nicotinate phosphoribosyltransferase n=1 Tax=Thalassotalea sp. G20_0 TaxID=2821093 RepID=UPI001ADAC236|nr:nicotinate phosphoribosyltransferase [Thalassotalea sp. G20_0]MBO9492549.1 nicotinate phosphoribosyltransferase [Thalassotalea sp. G20_0]